MSTRALQAEQLSASHVIRAGVNVAPLLRAKGTFRKVPEKVVVNNHPKSFELQVREAHRHEGAAGASRRCD